MTYGNSLPIRSGIIKIHNIQESLRWTLWRYTRRLATGFQGILIYYIVHVYDIRLQQGSREGNGSQTISRHRV